MFVKNMIKRLTNKPGHEIQPLNPLRQILSGLRQDVNRSVQKSRAKQKVSALVASGQDVKLEIGSGPVGGKNGWTTLDQIGGADILWDLTEGLPFPDDSVAMIYSSHLLEHFYYRDMQVLLKECYRVLKPGGIISACVPDASIFVKAYLSEKEVDSSWFYYPPAFISMEKMDIVNYIAYMDGHHRYMFDGNNLLHVLMAAGFVDVHGREFEQALDSLERRHESIYAAGQKPLMSGSADIS